jgi:hypothetical protein
MDFLWFVYSFFMNIYHVYLIDTMLDSIAHIEVRRLSTSDMAQLCDSNLSESNATRHPSHG